MRVMRILLGTALTAICLSLAGCLGFNFDLGINSDGLNTVPTPPPDDKTPKPYGIAKGINDTGITLCGNYAFDTTGASLSGDDNAIDCASAGALVGSLAKVGAGPAGFDYTKLDDNGTDLSDSAPTWHCLRDNVTGLTWEVKTDANVDDGYNWYNNDDMSNGDGSDDSYTD